MKPALYLDGLTIFMPDGTTAKISQTDPIRTPGLADTTDFPVMVGNVPGTIRASYQTLRELSPDPTVAAYKQLQLFAEAGKVVAGFEFDLQPR